MNTHIDKWFDTKISEYKDHDLGRECAYRFAKRKLEQGGKIGHPEKFKRKFIPEDGKIRKYLFEAFKNNVIILQFVVHKESKTFDLLKYPIYNDVNYINERIQQELCNDTVTRLTDMELMPEYMKCDSLKNKIKKLQNILTENMADEPTQKIIEKNILELFNLIIKHMDDETSQKISEKKEHILELNRNTYNLIMKQSISNLSGYKEHILELIPPGTKGVIRGNKFNLIIKQYILNLSLDLDKFKIRFEEICNSHFTTEIPDWYIQEKSTNKTIIGMNQLDLWSGGQQLNRGSKYLVNNKDDNENCKVLCVVCNEIVFKRNTNKAYQLFVTGYQNDTLCYLNNLQNIINSYFELL